MVALDISQNKIQGQIPEYIGDVFPQLQFLYMFSNELEGKIPWSFGQMKSIWDLDLSNNSLIGTIPRSLIEGCSSLRFLRVSNNHLEGHIPSFYLQTELETLNLRNNLLEGHIPKGICRLDTLRFIDLSYNKLEGPIPSCFSNLSSLVYVHLSNNKLRGQMITIWSPRLYTLDLNNKLYGSIPSHIANCTDLNALLLQGNSLDGEIPFQLCSLSLSVLDLSHNMLSGSIPSCLGRVPFLPYLFEDSSRILPDGLLETYVEKVGIFTDLVDFTTKSIRYSYDADLFDFFSRLSCLSGIDLSYNRLMGKIPHELGNLTNIHSLNLSHNHLWGDIPDTFSNLGQIESLDLSYNSLSGSIPTELTVLNFLADFRVEHNNLSGKIPFKSQFSTFSESSYKGNPFLCGPPLSKKCALPPTDANGFPDQVVENDSGWIDMETFYVTFSVTGMTMFLAVLIIFWINPNWRRAWFCLATVCVISSCNFVEDIIRKMKRVRSV